MARRALAAVALALVAAAAFAQNPAVEAGRRKAQMCAACHGPLGLASAPDAPHLAGQSEIYLSAQLRAYRSGTRRHEQMNVMARTLSDDDIAALAAWYAALRIEVQAPP
jgi:cytochrome c553